MVYSNVSVGSHFVDVKFIKDASVNNGNDSIQFKIQKENSENEGINNEDALISGTLTTYTNNRVTSIGSYAFLRYINLTSINFPLCTIINKGAFNMCTDLVSVNFPLCTNIGSNAFGACYYLASINFPTCTNIGSMAFWNCHRLTYVNFPMCSYISTSAFGACHGLISARFPACTTIDGYAFSDCTNLTSIYLLASSVCTLNGSYAFYSTKITSTTGSIFVPASLVNSYKAATNWVYFSNRIFGV